MNWVKSLKQENEISRGPGIVIDNDIWYDCFQSDKFLPFSKRGILLKQKITVLLIKHQILERFENGFKLQNGSAFKEK